MKRGKFAIRDSDYALTTSLTHIHMTRTIENQDNYYSVNADGTITLPAGKYIICATVHGVHSANSFIQLQLACGSDIANFVDHWTVTEQFHNSLSVVTKLTAPAVARIIGRCSLGASTVYGYSVATDTVITTQKIA